MTKFQVPAATRASHVKPDNRASAPADVVERASCARLPTASPRHGLCRPRKGNPARLTRTTGDWGMHHLNLQGEANHG
jgi:hypothetical protein